MKDPASTTQYEHKFHDPFAIEEGGWVVAGVIALSLYSYRG